MSDTAERMLRECIREILKEDDYGGLGLGDAVGGMGAGGMGGIAGSGDMYKVFIKPFADVIGVAAGKTKEVSTRAQTLLSVTFKTIASTLIPMLSQRYEEVFANQREEIQRIRSEYASVYQDTWDAFNEMDILIPLFMYRPDLFITAKFVKKAPRAAAKLLSVLSGGKLDQALGKLLQPEPGKGGGSSVSGGSYGPNTADMGMGYGGGGGFGESRFISTSLILEEKPKQQKQKKADPGIEKLLKLVNDERVREILTQSQVVQKMSREGEQLVRGTLKDVFEQAQGVLTAKSVDDLQRAVGKKLKGQEDLEKLPQNERQAAEAQLLKGLKSSMKAFYVKQLEEQLNQAVKAGAPDGHPFVNDYQSVIAKLKAL